MAELPHTPVMHIYSFAHCFLSPVYLLSAFNPSFLCTVIPHRHLKIRRPEPGDGLRQRRQKGARRERAEVHWGTGDCHAAGCLSKGAFETQFPSSWFAQPDGHRDVEITDAQELYSSFRTLRHDLWPAVGQTDCPWGPAGKGGVSCGFALSPHVVQNVCVFGGG